MSLQWHEYFEDHAVHRKSDHWTFWFDNYARSELCEYSGAVLKLCRDSAAEVCSMTGLLWIRYP